MGTIRDVGYNNLVVDDTTHTQTIGSQEEHVLNTGNLFQVSYTTDLGASESGDILVVTPNTTAWGNIRWDLQTEKESLFYIYENPTTTDNGTLITAYNKNRNSTTTDTMFFYDTPTGVVTTDLVAISETYTCPCVRITDDIMNRWVLDQNQEYLLRVTNGTTDSCHVSLRIVWAEVTNFEDL